MTHLINKKYNKLTIVEYIGLNKDKKRLFNFKCDCGNTKIIPLTLVKNNITKSCGCLSKKYFRDLTGKRFNELIVIKYLDKDNSNNHRYLCRCTCGKEIISQGSDVKMGKVKSCGHLKYKNQQELFLKDPYKNIKLMIYNDYKIKAKRRNYQFDLDIELFYTLIEQKCYYCGIHNSNVRQVKRKIKNVTYQYNGIDRINNDLGYTKDNVVSCCKLCNQAKHRMSIDSFKNWIKRIYEHLELNEISRCL